MKRFVRSVGLVVFLASVVVAIVATGATARSSANIKVCVLLPDTKSSVRWVQFDAPYFAKALKKAKVTYSITNALNDPQKMVSQADSCLSRGAKVAIVTDIAQGTSIAIEKKFAKAGGWSIDYDRQVVGGIAKVYVSFDGKAVGAAQARGVVNKLKGKSKPVVAELWGGPTDQNAFWFKSGNDAVLNPLFKSGKLTKGPQQFVPLWLATNAQPIFEQMLLRTNNKIDGAIAANDGIAGAVIAALKAKKLKPDRAVGTGRDRAGRAEHHLGLADDDRLQVRAPRGQRSHGGGRRAAEAQEGARGQRVPQERQQEGADRPDSDRARSRRPTTRDSSGTSSSRRATCASASSRSSASNPDSD